MSLAPSIEKAAFILSSFRESRGNLWGVIVVANLPTYLMIGIALNVSIVVTIDILKISVGICMDTLQTWLLTPLYVVDLVMIEEGVTLVDKDLVLTLFHLHLPSYLLSHLLLLQILKIYLVMRLRHFDILFSA